MKYLKYSEKKWNVSKDKFDVMKFTFSYIDKNNILRKKFIISVSMKNFL